MRFPLRILTSLALFLATVAIACAQEVTLLRVWPSYRNAASFTRLGEYFGARPDAINTAALRTRAKARAGYYWLIRTEATEALHGCSLVIEVQRGDDSPPETHKFPVDLPAGSHPIQAGITGRDWPDPEERPVAWQLTLFSADGTSLATQQSFLWERAPL